MSQPVHAIVAVDCTTSSLPHTCSQALIQMYVHTLNEQFTFFLCKEIDHKVVFLPILQRTMMRMRICRHCWQTGGREISQATIFQHCFFYNTFIQH